jgi:hypothetical protein
MKFQFHRGITTDGLPVGDMSKSQVIARRHAVYHSFILYLQREPDGHLFREIYKLQIIHAWTGKEFWIEEEAKIVNDYLGYNAMDKEDDMARNMNERVIDFLIKKCKEKYHMEKYFGFYMKKIKGVQFKTYKCRVCGLPYRKKKTYIEAMERRGFRTSCCSAKCKFKLLQYTHPSYSIIAKGILDWKPMKKIAEENGYVIDDKFRKTYDNIIKALNCGRKGLSIMEIKKKTGLGYTGIRKIFITAGFVRRKYKQKKEKP